MSNRDGVIVSKKLVATNALSAVVVRLINVSVLVWTLQYLLSRVPAEEFAVYPVVTAVMVFAPLFFALFTGGIARHVVDAYAKGHFEEVTRIVSSIAPMIWLAAALFFAVGTAFALNIDHILTVPTRMAFDAKLMMILLILSFAVQMVTLPFTVGYHVRQRFVEFNLLTLGRELLRVTLLFFLLFGVSTSVLWLVVATAVSEILFAIITLIRSRQMVSELRFRRRLFESGKALMLMSFGTWTTLGQLGNVLYVNAATLILNVYGTAIDVTSYFIGATIFRQLQGFIIAAIMPLQPALTAMNALDHRRRLALAVLRGGRYGLWVSMLVAAPLIIYADAFVNLYVGEEYDSAATVIILFMLIFPFNQPTTLLPMAAIATARVRQFFLPAFLFQLLGLVLMLASTIWLDLGATGVSLALTVITVGSQVTYFWRFCLRLTGVTFREFARRTLVPGFTPSATGATVWIALANLDPIDSWSQLIAYGTIGGAVYMSTLLVFCLDSGERNDLRMGFAKVRALSVIRAP